jgi:hypothetical protein
VNTLQLSGEAAAFKCKAAASVKGHAAMALGRSGSGVGGTCYGAAGNTQFDSMESEETDGIR